jgi:hypothetical protein
MTKRDEAFADLPTIALVKGNANFHALLSPPDGYDGPYWTAHIIGDGRNEVAAEIKRRWDSFEAMRKALEDILPLAYAHMKNAPWHPDYPKIEQARAALRLAEEGTP